MRVWLARAAIALGLALLGWVLWTFLAPRGLGWIVWALGALVLAFVLVELALRARRRAADERDGARWQAALDEPRARRAAIAELRRRIDRARRLGRRMRVEHARLTTLLAELLEADGKPADALAALAKVAVEELEPVQAAVVRHARAQAYLAAGDLDGAEITLSTVDERAGDPVLDASLALARAALALGHRRLDDAEALAHAVANAAEEGDELHDEARAILAGCLLARGDPDGARAVVNGIGEATRRRLVLVGPAALREVLAS